MKIKEKAKFKNAEREIKETFSIENYFDEEWEMLSYLNRLNNGWYDEDNFSYLYSKEKLRNDKIDELFNEQVESIWDKLKEYGTK